MNVTNVAINLIDPNPYRDFTLDPINPEHVAELAAGYNKDSGRDFGIIAVRPFGTRYQQVYGHHRLAAMREAGFTQARVLIETIDDDQLVREMVTENATQSGNRLPNYLDSVAAIIRRIAYRVLVAENFAEYDNGGLCGNPQRVLTTEQAFIVVKQTIINGDGLGRDIITRYCGGSMKSGQIGIALSGLKESGKYASLLTEVKAQVDAEVARMEAEEAAAQAAAEAARVTAAKREAEAKAEAERRAKDAAQASAARRAQAEAAAAEALARSTALAAERQAAAAAEAERRAVQAERQAATRRASEVAEAARRNAAEQTRGLDGGILPLFRNAEHFERFRRIVANPNNAQYFPLNGQVALVNEMYRLCDEIAKGRSGGQGSTTIDDIRAFLGNVIAQHDEVIRHANEQDRIRRERESKSVKANGIMDRFGTAAAAFSSALASIEVAMRDDELRPFLIESASSLYRNRVLDGIEETVASLRKNLHFGTYRSSIPAERVINPE